jgi:hypothetical protein
MTVPVPAPLQLQIATFSATVDCLTITMKPSARHSFPTVVAVPVEVPAVAAVAVAVEEDAAGRSLRSLDGILLPWDA